MLFLGNMKYDTAVFLLLCYNGFCLIEHIFQSNHLMKFPLGLVLSIPLQSGKYGTLNGIFDFKIACSQVAILLASIMPSFLPLQSILQNILSRISVLGNSDKAI